MREEEKNTKDQTQRAFRTEAFVYQRDLEGEITSSFVFNWFIGWPMITALFIFLTYTISKYYVTDKFIDEIFHVTMVEQYFSGDLRTWNPKITTPPGLYFLGLIWSKAISFLHLPCDPVGLTSLRMLNTLGGTIALPLALNPIFLLNPVGWWPTSIMLFPVLSTYYYLFYTDVWSTVFIVASLSTAIALPWSDKTSIRISAFFGFCSVWMRQTNIVWNLFILVLVIERRAMIQKSFTDSFLNNCIKFTIQFFEDFYDFGLPHMINFILFIVFLIYNRGITLGDKENHVAGFHVMQFLYCLAFITLFTWPIWFNFSYVKSSIFRYYYQPFQVFLELSLVMIMIRFFTVAHPFLLADNRHFVFYVWSKIINLRWYTKYLLAPVYHFSIVTVFGALIDESFYFNSTTELPFKKPRDLPLKLTGISIITLLTCIFLTVVPSPLFEPRYYIIPYIFFRVFVSAIYEPFLPGEPMAGIIMRRLGMEFAWLLMVNVATIGIFVFKTFEWDDEEMLQRIIW
jgi:alpha-1,2-glucosyltransferase